MPEHDAGSRRAPARELFEPSQTLEREGSVGLILERHDAAGGGAIRPDPAREEDEAPKTGTLEGPLRGGER